MAAWCQRRRVHDRESLDLLLMSWHRPVTVGRNGITLTLGGRAVRYGQFEPALAPFKAVKREHRRPVLVSFDPHDLDTIRVYDEQFHFICNATMNQTGGIRATDKLGVRDVAELTRRQARYNKASRDISDLDITQTFTTEEQLAVIAAERHDAAAATIAAENAPAPLKLVGTPLDGHAGEMKREKNRRAVAAVEEPADAMPRLSAMDRLRDRMASATPQPRRDVLDERPDSADPFERLRRLHA